MIRDKQIKLRATKEEITTLRAKAQTANMTLCEYLRQAGINASIEPRPSLDEIRAVNALLKEINPVGNNLNQIAVKLNAGAGLSRQEAESLKYRLSETARLFRELKSLLK